MNKYFKLKSECYLITGKKKSTIHNLLTGESLWINEENTIKLLKSESNKLVDISDKLYQELLNMGWGIEIDKPIFIDKLRTINSFNRKKLWLDTQNIVFATLHVTNNCNLKCEFCNKTFCPSCKKFENDDDKSLEIDIWEKIVDELILFGVKTIFITGGESTIYKDIYRLINYCVDKNLNVNVHTNGLKGINIVNEKVQIIISLFELENLSKILQINSNLNNVTLIIQEKDVDVVESNLKIDNKNWKIIKVFNFNEGIKISKDNLQEVNITNFTDKKLSDYCLKGKIFISYNGDVYPCCGDNKKILNLKEKNLSQAVKVLIKDYWNKPIEKNEKMRKCSQCEFRFSCKVCTFLDIDKYCTYNQEEGKWIY